MSHNEEPTVSKIKLLVFAFVNKSAIKQQFSYPSEHFLFSIDCILYNHRLNLLCYNKSSFNMSSVEFEEGIDFFWN